LTAHRPQIAAISNCRVSLIGRPPGLEEWRVAVYNPGMIRSLLEFHILERRAEGGWRVKERGPDLTDVLVVDFETLQEADSWITARQDGSKTNAQSGGNGQ